MALKKIAWPTMARVAGFSLGVARAGIYKGDRNDLVLMRWDKGAAVAGVFTSNRFCAAPVILARRRLEGCTPECFLINSGNANAGTGERGWGDACLLCDVLADAAGVQSEAVLPFSTGVIGQYLPVDRMVAALPDALSTLDEDNWLEAAKAIGTTDTCPKGASVQFELHDKLYTVTGIAKGSGMVRPDMATMLAYIATDLSLSSSLLQAALQQAVDRSFNRITVDGDTSTNDSCMLVATGRAENKPLTQPVGDLYDAFVIALGQVTSTLAEAIVRDGEGATKLATIVVEQAASSSDALTVAYTVAHSPLVKTALFASDPNWGRILAAVGRSGIDSLDIAKVSLWLGNVPVITCGQLNVGYSEHSGQHAVSGDELTLRISLGVGSATESILTTDLSYDYVKINAEYRT